MHTRRTSRRCEGCGLEYAGARGPRALPAQPYTILRGPYLRYRASTGATHRLIETGADDILTLGASLARAGFSSYFRAHFMTRMLSVSGSPVWRTVTGGSATCVDRIAARLHEVRAGTPRRPVVRHTDGVDVTNGDGTATFYDHVVVAAHPDQALRLLGDATSDEREILGAFRYSRNAPLLHTDTSLLPRTRGARRMEPLDAHVRGQAQAGCGTATT
nr:FAD-dependent oxidoreductase [Streptomyces sp. NRRL S-1022]